MGDRLQFSYHILTKTLTMRPIGDEVVMLDKEGVAHPLVTLSKNDDKNDNRYSVRFNQFIPTFTSENVDAATHLSNIIKAIKSIRVHSEKSDMQIKGIGTFTAELFKFTSEPHIKTEKDGTVTLHLHDHYTANNAKYTADKGDQYSFNATPSAQTCTSHSHTIIYLGDKSALTTDRIINEFMANSDWTKLAEALEIQTKSEGEQTFDGLKRDLFADMTYSGSKKTLNLHVDFNDIYSAAWKREYLPFLRSIHSLTETSTENPEKANVTDEMLLSLLPAIENNNPIKKAIDLNIALDNTHIKITTALSYDMAKHGAQLATELPLQKEKLWDIAKRIGTLTDKDTETLIDGTISIKLILKNNKAIFDDIEATLEQCKKTLGNGSLFGDLKANRQLADMLLTSFGKKIDDTHTQIQMSYDTNTKKINYDTAGNVTEIMSKLLPMFAKKCDHGCDHEHGEHEGHAHAH